MGDIKIIKEIYLTGREWSVAYFKQILGILGTHFEYEYFESEVAPIGYILVEKNSTNGIFEIDNGAVVF